MKYFLHDTNSFNDEKVHELYLNFGYEGLGLFYTALEKLAGQEKPIKTSVLKSQLGIGKKLDKCWKFMEETLMISSLGGDTFNEKLLNYSEKYQVKKQKNKDRISQWRDNQSVKNNVTHYEQDGNALKVKLSKVKESKVFINIGLRTIFQKPSDYLKENSQEAINNLLTSSLHGLNLEGAYKILDSEYSCFNFSDHNHVFNAFKKVSKSLLNGPVNKFTVPTAKVASTPKPFPKEA